METANTPMHVNIAQETNKQVDRMNKQFWNYFKVTDFCGRKGQRMIDGRVFARKVSYAF